MVLYFIVIVFYLHWLVTHKTHSCYEHLHKYRQKPNNINSILSHITSPSPYNPVKPFLQAVARRNRITLCRTCTTEF